MIIILFFFEYEGLIILFVCVFTFVVRKKKVDFKSQVNVCVDEIHGLFFNLSQWSGYIGNRI